jgi:hypothetical protein
MESLKKELHSTIQVLFNVQMLALKDDDTSLYKACVTAIDAVVNLILLLNK